MLLNMINKFNPFKGSQCEDNLEENCTKTFEETHAEDKSFTFISSDTGITETDYVVSMSEVVYNTARGFALHLPSSLKTISRLTSYIAKGAAIANHADVAWKAV
ncbi:MAG: hypothetical protein PG981_001186 [Wolbachia endosymbiont of Ctenocephalides orientis wCori]|nr:MAG: hypothetical protein PG981_001186 [Wolbachia endosymbiont of Ctenocephalides orientis wCori]